MPRFAFRFHPLYRAFGLPFGVTPRTSVVEFVDDHFFVRFGPWSLRTPLGNIVGCERTGPYSVFKTIGPAHLSLADHGITFATNREAGLCDRADLEQLLGRARGSTGLGWTSSRVGGCGRSK